jgi:hypothetical protein
MLHRAWVIEAAEELPTEEVTGFDLATHQLPAAEFLLKDVKFVVLDVMTGECPKRLKATFDVGQSSSARTLGPRASDLATLSADTVAAFQYISASSMAMS